MRLTPSDADRHIGATVMTEFQPDTAASASDLPACHVMLTTREAADYLGLAPATLNKWRCYGTGPSFVRLGRAIRYRRDDLSAFLSRHTTTCR